MASETYSRRSFLATSLSSGLAISAASSLPLSAKGKKIPIGLELYSVRDVLQKDLPGTVTAVAKQGYEVVEFFSSYFSWTPEYAKEVRKLLDDNGLKCSSTHNGGESFSGAGIQRSIDLNSILGSQYIVMAHPGKEITTIDGWKEVAATLNDASEKFKAAHLKAGYHNHDAEWKPIDGVKPIEVLAKNTEKRVMLQLDVGTCVETGNDPVAWIKANPGRINSIHCKEWSPEKGYKVLFAEGKAPWKAIFAAAEKVGGVEFYLIEQEGYDTPSLEAAEKCLENYKKLRA